MTGVSKDELRLDNRGSRETLDDLYIEGGCDEPRCLVLRSVVNFIMLFFFRLAQYFAVRDAVN